MSLLTKKVLITGVSGHLGLAILRAFIEYNNNDKNNIKFNIFGTVKTETSLRSVTQLLSGLGEVPGCVSIYKVDFTNSDLENEAIWDNEFDIVVHSAAMLGKAATGNSTKGKQTGEKFSPAGFYSSNVLGTARFYEILNKKSKALQKLVYISSGDVYGVEGIVSESALPSPKTAYAVSKYAGEILTKIFGRKASLSTVILRVGSIYGPGQRDRKGPNAFIEDIVSNNLVQIYGDGKQLRNFPYVMDVADVIIKSIFLEGPDILLNCGSTNSHDVNDILKTVTDLLEANEKNSPYCQHTNLKGDFPDFVLSMERAKKHDIYLSTDLADGIQKQIQSRSNGNSLLAIYEALGDT